MTTGLDVEGFHNILYSAFTVVDRIETWSWGIKPYNQDLKEFDISQDMFSIF